MNNNYGNFISPFDKYGMAFMTPFILSEHIDSITPPMIQKAYNIPTLSGKGIKIGIISAFEYKNIIDDFFVFCKRFSIAPGNVKIINSRSYSFATQITKKRWINESALDLQWTRSFAPDADINCYLSASDDLNDIFNSIKIADKECDIILLSFGALEFAHQLIYDDFFESADAFYICASGNKSTVYYPSSSKHTLSVGATEIYFDCKGNTVGREHYKKGGSGISRYCPVPEHQKEFIYANEHKRAIPDISFFSGGNRGAYFYCEENGGHLSANGTSVSASCMAGICASIASVDKKLLTKKASYFYELARKGNYNDLFFDITMGRNEFNKTAKGFDLCTGLGTPNVSKILNYLKTLS